MCRLAFMTLLGLQIAFGQAISPHISFEAPPELAAVRMRLESIDVKRLADVLNLVGSRDEGAPIHVILATEGSDWARETPPWISGFATGDTVVIFPVRNPGYPNDTLEDVLRHEIAHVLIRRASGSRPIPRWFNEGLAMAAERDRSFEDQTQLLYQLV